MASGGIDTICVPSEKTAHTKAIRNMHSYYSEAKVMLVHHHYFFKKPWMNAQSGCLSVVLSLWFTHGWTALELMKSKNVVVVFCSNDPQGHVLKSLDEGIIARHACSLPHQIATTAINTLRKLKGLHSINDLLAAIVGMPQSGSEPKFKPELSRTGLKFGPKFSGFTELDHKFGFGFG
jgi:hypothetical protein